MSVHINYGHSKREAELEDRCLFCDKHAKEMAYTYFGAPVCGICWDSVWRKQEDGECDPPFSQIRHKVSGEWLPVTDQQSAEVEALIAGDRAGRAVAEFYQEKVDALAQRIETLEQRLMEYERVINCSHNNIPPDDPDNPWTYRQHEGKTWNYCPDCGLMELWEGGQFFGAALDSPKEKP